MDLADVHVEGVTNRAVDFGGHSIELETCLPETACVVTQLCSERSIRSETAHGELKGVLLVDDIDTDGYRVVRGVLSALGGGSHPPRQAVPRVERRDRHPVGQIKDDGRFPCRQAAEPLPTPACAVWPLQADTDVGDGAKGGSCLLAIRSELGDVWGQAELGGGGVAPVVSGRRVVGKQ